MLTLAGLLCGAGCRQDQTGNATKVEPSSVNGKKGARKKKGGPGPQQQQPVREGRVQLSAFAKELEAALVGGDIEFVRQRFLDPERLGNCEVTRVRRNEKVTLAAMRELIDEKRRVLDGSFTATPGRVLAIIHKVRPKKRFMGGRVSGEDCPVDARGRVNVVVAPPSAPPDVIENRFETLFVADQWLVFAYDRIERDCSTVADKEAYGCRVLESAGQ
jgi:hypothetical protein